MQILVSLFPILYLISNLSGGYSRFINKISECPGIFDYHIRRGDLYQYGLVTIANPPVLGNTFDLIVFISMEGRLFKNQYEGRLELLRSRQETIQDIRARRSVHYVLHFPVQSSLPNVRRIIFNDRTICQTSGFPSLEMDKFITEIHLHHTLYTGLANQMYAPTAEKTKNPMKNIAHFANSDTNKELPTKTEEPHSTMFDTSHLIPDSNSFKKLNASLRLICGRTDMAYQKSPLFHGGLSIQRGSWPWLAAIYTVKATGVAFTCAGNLVSPRVIVSAAHCFRTLSRSYKPNEVLIALGRHDMANFIEDGSKLVEVSQIQIHEEYKKTESSFDADISVAILRKPIEYTEFIRPICLWESSNGLGEIVGTIGTVVGWGSDGHGQTVTQTPRSINIPIVSEVDCLRSSATFGAITSSRSFCAGRKDGFGPCHGDSGSGLAIFRDGQMVLRGIVSAALSGPMSTCDLSNYVVFTDVAKFVPWIQIFMS